MAAQRTGAEANQGFARTLDRRVRMRPDTPLREDGLSFDRLQSMVAVACQLLNEGAPATEPNKIHRLAKADTQDRAESLLTLATIGAPYAMLLYKHFLGRPFAGHRDSLSELLGGSLESAIEEVLTQNGLSVQKTKRAERVPSISQSPPNSRITPSSSPAWPRSTRAPASREPPP